MNYTDFIATLQSIAEVNGLSLIMKTNGHNSWLSFYLADDDRQLVSSDAVLWNTAMGDPRVLFDGLDKLAKEFKGESE